MDTHVSTAGRLISTFVSCFLTIPGSSPAKLALSDLMHTCLFDSNTSVLAWAFPQLSSIFYRVTKLNVSLLFCDTR